MFKASDLSVLAYANNFTLWHYITEDDDVQSPGYFNQSVDKLRKNDVLIVNWRGRTDHIIVVENDGSSVTVMLQTNQGIPSAVHSAVPSEEAA